MSSKREDEVEERGGAGMNKGTRDQDYVDVSTRGGYFFQVPKDWEVDLEVVGDEFFSILPKFLDLETLLATFGDALRT